MLSKLCSHIGKSFRGFTREDILSYLDSDRRTDVSDPLHKLIGWIFRVFIIKFFRWCIRFLWSKKENLRRHAYKIYHN